ncbi:hypothetical protein RRG08_051797 [Elysia crispata]|uniref:Uncharacterized protein n=1 Tax=Elysia crispata TaxID=231223 RepID=A0AAE1DSB2_9GAST|nr:hypothetical protein RRG08_051797 [Elysia crispata]
MDRVVGINNIQSEAAARISIACRASHGPGSGINNIQSEGSARISIVDHHMDRVVGINNIQSEGSARISIVEHHMDRVVGILRYRGGLCTYLYRRASHGPGSGNQ